MDYADQTVLEDSKRAFREARDMTQTARQRARIARRYYDGKNDPALERTLRRKKQPDFVNNYVRLGVEGIVGVIENGKTDPRAYPRNPQDDDASEVATDCLRFVSDSERWHNKKTGGFRFMTIEGVCAFIVEVDAKLDPKPRMIRYEEYFYDPYSRELDFGDKSYDGIAKWQNLDAVISAYPEYREALTTVCQSNGLADSGFEDRPNDGVMWIDARRKRLLVIEMYRLIESTWHKTVFVGDLVLEHGVSPYLDNEDQPCNPIEGATAYIDDENIRYGRVHDMMGPQDEINVYRRKAAHYATFRQLQETDPSSAGIDPEEARREAARADGVIPAGWGVVSNTDKFSMDQSLLAEAKGFIERTGPSPALIGRAASSSGRQDLVRQQAGLTELAHLYVGLEDLELRVYRQIWARIRQFWTDEKYVRVTDDEQAFKFVHINQPIMEMMPVVDPATGLPSYDPTTRQIRMAPQQVGVNNQVASMEMDIIVDTTPDTANVQQEQYDKLVELAKVYGPQEVPFDDILRVSSLPKKRELMDARKARQQQGGQPSPEQQEAQQIAKQTALAELSKTQSETAKNEASALKTVSDTRAQNLETDLRGVGF